MAGISNQNWVKVPPPSFLFHSIYNPMNNFCWRTQPTKPQFRLSTIFRANNSLISRVIWCTALLFPTPSHPIPSHTYIFISTHYRFNGNSWPMLHYLWANFGWQNKNRLTQRQKLHVLRLPRGWMPFPQYPSPYFHTVHRSKDAALAGMEVYSVLIHK